MATLPVDRFTHMPPAQPYWLYDWRMESGPILFCKGFRNGKPHYIGPAGVAVDIGERVKWRLDMDRIRYQPHRVPRVPRPWW